MNTVAPLKGYVLRDGAGICGIVPNFQGNEDSCRSAWKYIRENKVLKTLYAEPGEDIIDFVIRVHEEAKKVRSAMEPN